MKNNSVFAAISRRDAIGLIAAVPASGAVLAGSLPALASAPSIGVVNGVGHTSAKVAAGLARLSAMHFEPLVGQKFSIGGDRATLTEVRRGPQSGPPFRQQFALTFSAPQRGPMPSDVVAVSHPAIGRHDLHVAQVGGAALEICFS